MRNILVIAALLVVGGTLLARYADRFALGQRADAAQTATGSQTETRSLASRIPHPTSNTNYSGGNRFTARAGSNGHVRVEGRADGRPINFIVDTGASVVTLRESDAARVGVFLSPSDFRYEMSTANGAIRAAKAELNRLEIGNIELRNVVVAVLPDKALGENLLGNTFLSRLRRFQMSNGVLEMEQ